MRYLTELAQHNPWGLALLIVFAVWAVLVAPLMDRIGAARPDREGTDVR